MTQPEALSNIGTSKVFLSLLLGKKNPKAIADFLGIKPPPVIEQLRRLQETNIIELGEKEGKEQTYRIKWREFLSIFINVLLKQGTEERDKIEEDRPEEKDQIRMLADNKYFKQSIIAYLKSFTELEQLEWKITINYMIFYFERTLAQASYLEKKKNFEEREKREFFEKMRLWRKRILSSRTWRDVSFHNEVLKFLD